MNGSYVKEKEQHVDADPGDPPFPFARHRENMSVLLARLSTFFTIGWMFGAAFVVGFVVIGMQEWFATGQTSLWRVIVMLSPAAIFAVAFRRRWTQIREDENAELHLTEGVSADSPRNLQVVDVSLLVQTIRMTAWTLPFWILLSIVVPLSLAQDASPLSVLLVIAVGLIFIAVVIWGRAVRPSIAARFALIAPLVLVAVAGVEASSAWRSGKLTTDLGGILGILLLVASAIIVSAGLTATLYRLERSAHVKRLKRIERRWMTHRHAPAFHTQLRKAPVAFLMFHLTGTLLGLTAFVIITATVPSMLGIGLGVGAAIYLAWRRLARGRIWPTEQEIASRDARPPILFLRSFADDEIGLPAAGPEQSIAEWAARQFSRIGPVIALAPPSERGGRVGPYQVELVDRDWQNAVATRIDKARFVVVLFGVTQGLMWELQQIAAQHAEHRTFIMFPPIRPLDVARRWQQLDAAVQRMPSLSGLFHVDPCRIRFAHVGHGNALTTITCAFKSRTAYEFALAALMSMLDPDGTS